MDQDQRDSEGSYAIAMIVIGSPIGSLWDDIPPINSRKLMKELDTLHKNPLALLDPYHPGQLATMVIWCLIPFAGCATACVAAERLGRQWMGIDISDKAARTGPGSHQEGDQPVPQLQTEPPIRYSKTDGSWKAAPVIGPTSTFYSASRKGFVGVARWLFHSAISPLTTSFLRAVAGVTTWRICNCCAGPATA